MVVNLTAKLRLPGAKFSRERDALARPHGRAEDPQQAAGGPASTILLDVMMPGMQRRETCWTIKL
jgi:CheY-like chemotaxis protein